MEYLHVLPTILILIGSAVVIVILFKSLNLSPVLGYLCAGMIIGDYGLAIVPKQGTTLLAEMGVVFLLFAIGLELSFERLKAMRKYIFGLGSLQVFLTALIISGFIVIFIQNDVSAIIIGLALSLSSTAIVMQILNENRIQSTQLGRTALSILLQQDFVVVPLLVVIPLLKQGDTSSIALLVSWSFVKAILALIVIIAVGRMLFRPLFKLIISKTVSPNNELFIATVLFIALSASWGTEYAGLSAALGAFVAGVLVAETEFRHQAEESIAPFKGLLLGLFFMSVGMTMDIQTMYAQLTTVILLSLGLIIIKATVIFGLYLLFGFHTSTSIQGALLLAQGGEFAFILFDIATKNHIIDEIIGKTLLLVVTTTMGLTPILNIIGKKISGMIWKAKMKSPVDLIAIGTQDLQNHVIIAGFSTVGKTIAKVLQHKNIGYVALDINEDVIEENKNEFPVFKGDISQVNFLAAAGISRAVCMVITIDNEITLKKTLRNIAAAFPNVPIIAKTKDLSSASHLYSLGVHTIIPESYETGLLLSNSVLKLWGVTNAEIFTINDLFRDSKYTNVSYNRASDLSNELVENKL